jgi:hypothetical protein
MGCGTYQRIVEHDNGADNDGCRDVDGTAASNCAAG